MKHTIKIYIIFLFWGQLSFATFVPIYKGAAGGLLGVDAFRSEEVPPSTQVAVKRHKNLALREFAVYLPPGYFDDAQQVFEVGQKKSIQGCGRVFQPRHCFDRDDQFCARSIQAEFPIVYFLNGDATTHLRNFDQFFVDKMDLLISSGTIAPFVLISVASDTTNPWGPCGVFETNPPSKAPFINGQYVNSSLTGFFESYITRELYQYVQERYRVSCKRELTGIFGYSQGGYGALLYAAKHSQQYGLLGIGAGLFDYINRFIPSFASVFMLQKSMGLIQKLTPNGDDTMLEMFAESAARSPQIQLYAPGNPGYKFGVALPFDLKRNIFPEVVEEWKKNSLDTIVEQYAQQLKTVKILAFHGVRDNNVQYVGARDIFDLMLTYSIDPVFITHEGDHFTLPSTVGLPLFPFDNLIERKPEERLLIRDLVPTLQFFSACILSDEAIDAHRSRIVGVGSIALQGNSIMSLGGDTIVGVETDVQNNITQTGITLRVTDNAQFDIGKAAGPGGALQVGNSFSKQQLIDMPALQDHSISFTLDVDGPSAQMIVGPRGFLGFGAGLKGKGLFESGSSVQADAYTDLDSNLSLQRELRPSNWVVASLQNVKNVGLLITRGAWRHQQIRSSNEVDASLIVFGQSDNYTFKTSANASIFGGGNMMKLVDSLGVLANVTNTVESPFSFTTDSLLLYPFGVTDINTPRSSFFPTQPTDPFGNGFPFRIASRNAPSTVFQRQLLASTPLLLDPDLNSVDLSSSVDFLFDTLGVAYYEDQINKRCPAAYNSECGDTVIGYTNESDTAVDFLLTRTFLHEINRDNAKLLQVPDCLRSVLEKQVSESVENYGALTIRINDESKELQYNGAL